MKNKKKRQTRKKKTKRIQKCAPVTEQNINATTSYTQRQPSIIIIILLLLLTIITIIIIIIIIIIITLLTITSYSR